MAKLRITFFILARNLTDNQIWLLQTTTDISPESIFLLKYNTLHEDTSLRLLRQH